MALRTRKVQGKATEVAESFIFNGNNGSEVVQFFLDRGERADNFGNYIIWADPDTNSTKHIVAGERVVIIKDTVYVFPDELFKLVFETAK